MSLPDRRPIPRVASFHLSAALVMLALAVVGTQAVAAAASSQPATAVRDSPLHVVYESAVYNPATGSVEFTIQFNRRPNFRKTDEVGRHADAFQYFIVGDAALRYPANFDAIIRGSELTLPPARRLLPIRNSSPSDSDPAAGGWGTIRAAVPFRLRGHVLTFSAPLAVLSDHSTDGRFAYILETYNFGSLSDSITSDSLVAAKP